MSALNVYMYNKNANVHVKVITVNLLRSVYL